MKSNTCKTAKADALLGAYLLRPGDCALVLAQRLCEWIGNAHSIEEELALGNIGLDLLGQARSWLALAGSLDGTERSEDDLAYWRDEREWRNFVLCEQPNGDFAKTTVRHILYGAYQLALLRGMKDSREQRTAGLAAVAHREAAYHYRHFSAWLVRLSLGTEESRERVEDALGQLWPLCGEMLAADKTEHELAKAGLIPDAEAISEQWFSSLEVLFAQAQMQLPAESEFLVLHGRSGMHSESLGRMLAEMQSLTRMHPQAAW